MIEIKECNFNDEADCKALVDLLNHYMSDKMGGCLPVHTPEKESALIYGLKKHPSKLVLLAIHENSYAGLLVSFINFSTFSARPFINIHDIVVLDKYRGQGIGRRLIEEVFRKAEATDCSKITLEVREDNDTAQTLYSSLGFKESTPMMHFWTKHL
jgi:GNAT superfamily N-acetyltransferase